MSLTVAKHAKEYHDANKTAPPWNTIKTTASGSPVSFETDPDRLVDRKITESLSYGSERTHKLPTTTFEQLENLTYISRAADRCTWHGKDCVFKRIEFDVDIRTIGDEIRTRETLIDAIGTVGIVDVNVEMTNRFLVVPIVAVVIWNSKPWKPGTVAGVLMPFAGQDLEILVRDPDPALSITERQFRDLVLGVRELGKCGVQHGDIRYWNTVLQPAGEDGAEAKLVLIDIGSEAPDYDGDVKALGTLLLWCLGHTPSLSQDEAASARVEAAAAALAQEDLDAALKALSSSGV